MSSQRILIVGVSESGKSSLARKIIERSGLPCFVRDPFLDEWPNAQIVTPDFDEMRAEVMKYQNPRIAVADEAGDVLSVGDRGNHCFFTSWRHHGIIPIAIAQRMTMIAPNVRTSSTDLYLFESALADCEILARDKNCPELVEAANFVAGDFFHLRKKDGKRVLTRHRLW